MKETIKNIREIISEAEAMKGCYFWQSPGNAGARRSYEKKHSHDLIEWTDGNDIFTASYTVRCSCANIYATGTYTRNGQRTTLTAVKNSLKRLEAVAG